MQPAYSFANCQALHPEGLPDRHASAPFLSGPVLIRIDSHLAIPQTDCNGDRRKRMLQPCLSASGGLSFAGKLISFWTRPEWWRPLSDGLKLHAVCEQARGKNVLASGRVFSGGQNSITAYERAFGVQLTFHWNHIFPHWFFFFSFPVVMCV